jgi:hypothetical protein
VKLWAKIIQLFLGEKSKLFFHFWSKRGGGQKEEGHFWAKRVQPGVIVENKILFD